MHCFDRGKKNEAKRTKAGNSYSVLLPRERTDAEQSHRTPRVARRSPPFLVSSNVAIPFVPSCLVTVDRTWVFFPRASLKRG